MNHCVRSIVTLLLLLTASLPATAFTTRPVDGLWGLDSELNLAVGRAFNFELTGNILVATMYTYNAQRAPTFYTAAGVLDGTNRMIGTLAEPQGGTCLGCAPTSGSLLSIPGTVTFEFTTSTTGFVTLPGEVRKAMRKGAIAWPVAPNGLRGVWVFTSMSTTSSQPIATADVAILNTLLGATSGGSGLVASANGRYGCEQQITGVRAGQVFCLLLGTSAVFDKAATSYWWGDNMDGVWKYTSINATDLFTAKRIISPNGDTLDLKSAEASDTAMQQRLFDTMQRILAERFE
jgi:hypothetical protein